MKIKNRKLTLREETIFCNKRSCKKCANREGHPGYWKMYIDDALGNTSIYIGRLLGLPLLIVGKNKKRKPVWKKVKL